MHKLIRLFREMGCSPALFYSLGRLLSRLSNRCGVYYYYIYQQPLIGNPNKARAKGRFQYRWLNHYDETLQTMPRPEPLLQARFDQQVGCLIATIDKDQQQQLVGCIWVAMESYEEDEVPLNFVLPSCSVWDFDVYITERYRVGLLFHRLWMTFGQQMIDQGYRYSMSRISAFNQPSVRAHEKLGAQRIGRIISIKLGSYYLIIDGWRVRCLSSGRHLVTLRARAID